MKPLRRTALLAVAALLGIGVAVAITWGTSQLVRQHIGLSGEPLGAAQGLVPSPPTTTPRGPTGAGAPASSPASTAPAGGTRTSSASAPHRSSSGTKAASPARPEAPSGSAPVVVPVPGSGRDESGSGRDD